MEFPGAFHPQIVHTPIALIIVGAVFELIGRATDIDWWRKAAFAMLVIGVLGAGAAVLSGQEAGESAEHQGVAESAVDAHEDIAKVTLWIGIAAVLARALAGRAGRAKAAVGLLALGLHLAAAVTVGIAGYRGGKLVYEHGANVKVKGAAVTSDGPAKPAEHESDDHDD
jgi:uncharacterized membrane protein